MFRACGLLHRFVEEPYRHPRRGRALRPARVFAFAAAASLVFAGGTAGVNQVQSRTPIASAQEAAKQPLSAEPTGTSFVPSNLTPSLRDASASIPDTYGNGCHADAAATQVNRGCVYGSSDPSADIVLFGDSHAAQWFPAVEDFSKQNSLRLHNFTKSSCPSVDIEILNQKSAYAECEEWRADAIKLIGEIKPRIVVLSNYGYVEPVDASTPLSDQWESGLSATLSALPEETAVFIVADTPRHEVSPLGCLSQNTQDASVCDVPRSEGLNADTVAAEENAAAANGATIVDLTDYLCSDTCPVIIGDTLVYRDAHHITVPFSRELLPPLAKALEKAL